MTRAARSRHARSRSTATAPFRAWTTSSARGCARPARSATVEPGEVLFREGDAGYDFFVVESGAVAIVQGYGHENRVIAVHGRAPLPRRDQPADRLAAVPDRGGARRRRGDPGVGRCGCARSLAEDEELSNIDPARVHVAPLDPDRHRRRGEAGRLALLAATPAACASSWPATGCRIHWMDLEDDEEADALLRALGVRRRRDAGRDRRRRTCCATRATPRSRGCSASARAARRPRCAIW